MKIVWFSHFVPFPPRGGNLQRSFNLIRQASSRDEIHLMALNVQGDVPQTLHEYEMELKKYCASVEMCELPFAWRGKRWGAEALCSPLFNAPFSCRALYSRAALVRWKQLLHAHRGALVHFDSIDLALYADCTRNFRKVLNHHNCESAMAYRRAGREKNPFIRKYLLLHAVKLARIERSLCHQFEINLVVSEQDRLLLQSIQPNARYHVVENGVDTHEFVPVSHAPEAHSAIFTGSLGWGPNASAVDHLVHNIWPRVKERHPNARLYLAGKNPTRHLIRWPREDPSITVVANPEDMRPWLARAAVCVCPILEGGGTRLKILDAMAMGRPVVSSAIGCEGLRVVPGENILVAANECDFADKVSQLFDDRELQRRIGAAGRELVEREYCWERIGQQLQEAYACAFALQRAHA